MQITTGIVSFLCFKIHSSKEENPFNVLEIMVLDFTVTFYFSSITLIQALIFLLETSSPIEYFKFITLWFSINKQNITQIFAHFLYKIQIKFWSLSTIVTRNVIKTKWINLVCTISSKDVFRPDRIWPFRFVY